MKKISILFIIFFVSYFANAQEYAKYWVSFQDKKGTTHTVDQPETFLSPQAIEKREKFNIEITEQDLPVSSQYVKQVLALSPTNQLLNTSKWMNGITIYSEDEQIVEKLKQLSFVLEVEKTIPMKGPDTVKNYFTTYYNPDTVNWEEVVKQEVVNIYGLLQNKVNNAHWLQRFGYYGEGVTMMILDGGFNGADTNIHFAQAYKDNRVRGVRNFVNAHENPYRTGDHGTHVWSNIGSNLSGIFSGTAPQACYYLAQSEDPRSEYKVEEDNWVAAIEWADSLGVDVVNSSLGYTLFDDSTQNRTYADLNGKVSRASQAATIAASKGMIICNSAGNSGGKDDAWWHIGFPSDAKDILTVGAVNTDGERAPFSSYGYASDGRIKPDAAAVGWNAIAASIDGDLRTINGTSFSSPLLAGMVACLWNAFPDKTNYEVMDAVRKSGAQYQNPDTLLGYGITDFLKAFNLLLFTQDEQIVPLNNQYVYNGNVISFQLNDPKPATILYRISTEFSDEIITKKVKVNEKTKTFKLKVPKATQPYDYHLVEINYNGESYNFIIGQEGKAMQKFLKLIRKEL